MIDHDIKKIKAMGVKNHSTVKTWSHDPKTGEKRPDRKWKLIKDGVVINTIVAQPEFLESIKDQFDMAEEIQEG